MKKPAACRCSSYDPACTRRGGLMTLRDWELCANKCPPERPCRPDASERYRRHWDSTAEPPWKRFLRALLRHARDWFRRVSKAQYLYRLAVCGACPHYVASYPGGRCVKCGCGLAGKVMAKASWKSEKCPIGKW